VWVTPFDIRPDYDDLMQAAMVEKFSYLFESRTVLGRNAQDVVQDAWDFERLGAIQRRYCEVYEENLARVVSEKHEAAELVELAKEEMAAHRAAMVEDPLLPSVLWPPGYIGRRVFGLHKTFMRTIATRL